MGRSESWWVYEINWTNLTFKTAVLEGDVLTVTGMCFSFFGTGLDAWANCMCYIKHFLTLLNSTFLISYSASVVTSTTRVLIGMNQNHREVHLKGPALTYVQSIFLPALSYELCSYTSICFHSILSETFMMLFNTNFKCHILCMKCFMQNMLYVIVKSQISIGFQQFHQHLNIYRPFLNSMVIEMLNLLIEWHITSFTRKIVFQLLHLFLLRNTYYK